MSDCYWYQVLADLGLLGTGFFATLWFFLRRRYREQREMFNEYVKNVQAVNRHFDMLEYERYSQAHQPQGEEDPE